MVGLAVLEVGKLLTWILKIVKLLNTFLEKSKNDL